jgi:hypothetical protein
MPRPLWVGLFLFLVVVHWQVLDLLLQQVVERDLWSSGKIAG